MKHACFQITQKLFIRRDGKFLVLRDRKSGYGDLPGGRITEEEFFGSWTDSVKREITEELGDEFVVNVNPEPAFLYPHRVNLDDHPCLIIAYHADYVKGEPVISDEHDYMSWEEIKTFSPESLFSEYMLEAVKLYQEKFA